MHSSPEIAKRWRIGTRGSPLALAQAEEARRKICSSHGLDRVALELYPISTTGDRRRDRPLAEFGGKGLFSKEIDAALLSGDIDIAVHSAKDLPGTLTTGIAIAAVLPREDPRDCLICRTATVIGRLPPGSRVGTCSPRRKAQILHLRPDLEIGPIRGNIGTRLASIAPEGSLIATVLASAGLRRLGIRATSIHPIGVNEMLPAIGQGVIAIVVRKDDRNARALVSRANHRATAFALTAERSLLRSLEGDCHSPISGMAAMQNGMMALEGEVLRLDGSERIRKRITGPAERAEWLGQTLAEEFLRRTGPEFWQQPR